MRLPIPARLIPAVGLALILGLAGLAAADAAGPLPYTPDDAPAPSVTPLELLAERARRAPMEKIEPRLREVVLSAPQGREEILVVKSAVPVDLGTFGSPHAFTWPAGEHVAVLKARAGDIQRIAALPGVAAVESGDPAIMRTQPLDGMHFPQPARLAPADFASQARAAGPWRPSADAPAATDVDGAPAAPDRREPGAQPDGWFDVRDGHAAREAWELGYRGEGVRVAVLDNAVDFAHHDLQDTWAVFEEGHPYAGWPQAFDPYAAYLYSLQENPDNDVSYTDSGGTTLISLYQDSAVEERDVGGEMRMTACFEPLYLVNNQAQKAPEMCDFVVPESAGGTVRYGHHWDTYLRGLGAAEEDRQGEYAGVLLVDTAEAGVFDTVYVDLDNDHDFAEEKPVTRESPLSWRDVTEPPDEIPDVTGGLLTYLADGALPIPGGYLFGVEGETFIPEAGRMVQLFGPYDGNHGTLCASNIVSQGRLGLPPGAELDFEDLDGPPEAMNLGLAPDATFVSIGSVYAGGRIMFDVGWRYATMGHSPDHDDIMQVTSNSYGFSDVDNDGWDADSRMIDHYLRTYAPSTSMLFSTGNGAPGYGTLAPPSPQLGLGIAASTQMGSTGYDSARSTSQITFGDIIPFSNRGPGADGRNGPTVAADGAYAAGATTINGIGDGRNANGTWGGTSRSSPVAAGAMALVYDAFREAHDRWPTIEEARAALVAGARFAGYDSLVMGGGVVDAADAVRVASGRHGVYAQPSEWNPGGYRGERHEGFVKLMEPGQSQTDTIELHNAGEEDVEVSLSAQTLRRVGSYDFSMTSDRTQEGPSSPSAPHYLIPIDREEVPEGTELMVLRGVQHMDDFDAGRDLAADNTFQTFVYQHTDVNGNGRLWEDRNGNGVVDFSAITDSYVRASWDENEGEYSSLEGAITAPLDEEGLEAEIAWYGLACNDDEGNPPPPAQDVQEKIALIERGGCTFVEKLTNAMDNGAIGAVLFTDNRAKAVMGGDSEVGIPGVMIDRAPGLVLQDALEKGSVMTGGMFLSDEPQRGLGVQTIRYDQSEIEEFEYMRFTQDNVLGNNWSLSVHHPLERWADGIYLGVSHVGATELITNTELRFRADFYAWQDWDLVELETESLTVPAGGSASFEAVMTIPQDATYGTHPGAIFVDYDRGEGDEPVAGPGGYEIEGQRVVIPSHANVSATYDWQGAITFGGEAARDADAPYDNGAVRGAQNWGWRPESGDWRFFYADATEPPSNTWWLFRTTWDDPALQATDIDTRILGPNDDPFSNPDHPANGDEDVSDPDWYGPYGMEKIAQSPYLNLGGGLWPFQTSSDANEDWLAAESGGGLHELMLHNVMFSGESVEIPFESTVSSIQLPSATVELYGEDCGALRFTSQMELPGLTARGFGMAEPEVFTDEPIQQDDPDDRTTSSFKHDVTVAAEAGRFRVQLDGQDGDDLDLVLLRDANGDGDFAYPDELVMEGTSPDAHEVVEVPGFAPPGEYQIWVHGWSVPAGESSFDLEVDVVQGDSILVGDVPDKAPPGEAVEIEVCADTSGFGDAEGPLNGLLVFGPSGAPTLFQMPVVWMRDRPVFAPIYLPMALKDAEISPPESP